MHSYQLTVLDTLAWSPWKTGIAYILSWERVPLFRLLWGKRTPWLQNWRIVKQNTEEVCWGLAADWPPVASRTWRDRKLGLPWLWAGSKRGWWLDLEWLEMCMFLTQGTQRFPDHPDIWLAPLSSSHQSGSQIEYKKTIKKIKSPILFHLFSIWFHSIAFQHFDDEPNAK